MWCSISPTWTTSSRRARPLRRAAAPTIADGVQVRVQQRHGDQRQRHPRPRSACLVPGPCSPGMAPAPGTGRPSSARAPAIFDDCIIQPPATGSTPLPPAPYLSPTQLYPALQQLRRIRFERHRDLPARSDHQQHQLRCLSVGHDVPVFGSSLSEWNDIYGNGSGTPGRDLRNGVTDIVARYVYWGTEEWNVIETMIWDDHDDSALGAGELRALRRLRSRRRDHGRAWNHAG